MPNRQIYNNQPNNVEVQIYGKDPRQSVNIDTIGRVSVTGLMSITALTPLSVTGAVIGNLTVVNTPSITIVGTPNVSITGTPVVSGTVRVEGTPTIQVGAHGFTQINQTFNVPSGLLTVINTRGVNIANLNNFSYYIQTPSGLLNLGAFTINSQLSPDNINYVTDTAFTNATLVGLNLNLGGNLTTNKYLFYSRLQFNIPVFIGGGTMTVIFLGQY